MNQFTLPNSDGHMLSASEAQQLFMDTLHKLKREFYDAVGDVAAAAEQRQLESVRRSING